MIKKESIPIISVIVPIYNAEKFLSKTLNSIAMQTFKDVEVILVDDGSIDKSVEIAQGFADKYKNFSVIKKINGGPSSARNMGLEVARGKYVAFIDSDDFIHPQFLEKLYNAIKYYNADISCCSYFYYFSKRKLKIPYPFRLKTSVYTTEQALKKLIADNTIGYFMCNKLFKRSLFYENNIFFKKMYFEDIVIALQLFYHAKRVAVISERLYYYTLHKGSILTSMNATKINDYIISFGAIRDFLERHDMCEIYKKCLLYYSKKVALCSLFWIFEIHFGARSFKGISINARSALKSLQFFTKENYKVVSKVPQMPYQIRESLKKSSFFKK
ncbi:MAG: glycosyltransferase [Oscillospiraceae bacterium]|nr:glycosyltransferase [Oscillospiraceae bacterium]